ncbi:MAG: tripartite tricarboxylate transporter substrate binding protein, partial [Smithellaceae bacterium]|nr:tripartite tricarboxylate transporter substrate binding protein [Smithellaceae bacterium]
AKEMSAVLGQPVVPVNKPGGGGAVTYTFVKNSKPDGYTIGWNSMSILTSTNIGNVPFDYDALDNIGMVLYQPFILAVRADAKWKTLREFIEDAKKNPDMLKLGNAGAGSSTHISGLAIEGAAGCKLNHVPLGTARRNVAILSGEVDAIVSEMTGVIDLYKAKKIRFLNSMSEKRNPLIPEVPTAKEEGYDVALEVFRGLSLAKGTPPEIKAKLVDAMIKAANSKAMLELAEKSGFTIYTLREAEFEPFLAKRDKLVKDILKKIGLYRSQK